jgi:hypothetical protein
LSTFIFRIEATLFPHLMRHSALADPQEACQAIPIISERDLKIHPLFQQTAVPCRKEAIAGHLTFRAIIKTGAVFADNGPGWKMLADGRRDAVRRYEI